MTEEIPKLNTAMPGETPDHLRQRLLSGNINKDQFFQNVTNNTPKIPGVPGFLVRNVIGKAEKNPEPWLSKLKNVNPDKLNNVIKINPEAFKGVNNNSVASNIKLSYNLKDMGTLKTFLAKQAASKNHPGLWANIRAKKARGGKPAKPGDEAYPDKKNWSKLTHKSADDQNGHPVLDTIGAGVVGTGLGALGGGAMARSNITSTQNGYYLDKLNRGLQTAKLRGIKPKSMSLELEGAPEGVKLPEKFTGKIPAEAIERGWSPFAKIISKARGRGGLIGGGIGLAGMGLSHLFGGAGTQKQAGLENYEGMGTTDPTSSHQDILNGILRNQGQPTPAPTPVATPKPAPLPIPAPAPHYPAGQSAEGMPGNNAITPNHLNFLQDMQNMQQQHNQTLPAYNLGKQGESKLAACLAALNKLSLN